MCDRDAAIHEAAHGCADLVFGVPVDYVALDDNGGGHCCTLVPMGALPPQAIILSALAGVEAERLRCTCHTFVPFDAGEQSGGDMWVVRTILAASLTEPRFGVFVNPASAVVDAVIEQWRSVAAHLVQKHWPWICRVADELRAARRLSGLDIGRLRSTGA